jgi:AraC-like DNA-binding protein
MSMELTIPRDVCDREAGRTAIHLYESSQSGVKTRVTLQTNLFSFLLEGEKIVHRPGEPICIHGGEFLLLGGGNTLMSERLSVNGSYRSLLFFFDDTVFRDLLARYPALAEVGKGDSSFVPFVADDFIHNYLQSLELMLAANPALQADLQLLKLEELMLYLAGMYPDRLGLFRLADAHDADDRQLMAVAEGNIPHAVTVDELAFLCNMSVSTFKRRFARIYSTSPNRWLLQKRMELAAGLLNSQVKPSEVYHQVGYENHSSFTQSFKQVYGMTPREFQKMNVYP